MTRSSERHTFPTKNGLRLAAIIERPASDPRGVMLFSHCFTCSKDLKTVVRLSRQLAELGWLICRYDFRGIGQSEGRFVETNFHTNLEDLAFMCEGLLRIGVSVDFLFGHSFGGVASTLAGPLMNSYGNTNIKGIIALAAPSDTSHLADILVSKNPLIETNGTGEVEIGGKAVTIAKAMLEDFRSTDFAGRLHEARKRALIPQLIIHSIQDETVSYAHALRLLDMLRHPSAEHAFADVSLCTLPGADHLLARSSSDLQHVATVMDAWCSHRV